MTVVAPLGSAVGEGPPERSGSAIRRLASHGRSHLWGPAVVYLTVALLAAFRDRPISHVADNRFDQFQDPWGRVATWFSAWDGDRGLGDVREDVWPGTTLPAALFRWLGASSAVTVRVWHAVLLAAVATGVVAVLRMFRPRIGAFHLSAGAFTAFGPYSATFLVPSNLYAMFALCPWFVVICGRGLGDVRAWRWPATFGLVVFAAGNVDPPGLLYALVPAILMTLYVVGIERTSSVTAATGWWLRVAALAAAVSAWPVAKTYVPRVRFGQRLSQTELATAAAETSSWPEVFRGLGNWLSYFIADGQPVKPQGVVYFANWVVVLATFLVPILALAGLWLLRWRPRVLFGSLIFASFVLVAGGFGRPTPPPVGAAMLWSLENFTVVSGLRNTYKAGGGLAIGSAVLASATLVARPAWRRRGGRGVDAARVAVGAFALIAVATPFWSGNLYHPRQRSGPVPEYWSEAFDFLDDLPDGGRTLVVPAASRAHYRWGHVGDDIFDALLDRPHAVATGVPLSGPSGADLLEVISRWSVDPVHQPGVVGAIARRLGITEIVVRNDLDWQANGQPRPLRFEGLRNDRDFERIGTFGARGENVVGPDDESPDADLERLLPPVEIYRLRQPTGLVQVRPSEGELLVSGDGSSWPALHRAGLLPSSGAIHYSGYDDPAPTSGTPLVVTDTARRRVRTILDYEPWYSHTLAADQDLGRTVHTLFPGHPEASTVAWFADATAIDGDIARLGGFRPEERPAAAFDNDPSTSWKVPRIEAQRRRTIFVHLREPTEVSSITLRALIGPNGDPTVRRVRLRFSDESEEVVDIDESGVGSSSFEPRTTTFLEIFAQGIDPTAGAIGLRDVEVPGLDLREFVQAPTDALADNGDSTDATGGAGGHQTTMYVFHRVGRETNALAATPPVEAADEEHVMRRRFLVADAATFAIAGSLHVAYYARDDLVDAVLASVRPDILSSTGRGWTAVDGDETTGWPSGGDEDLSLTLSADGDELTRIEIDSHSDERWRPITSAVIEVGEDDYDVTFEPVECDSRSCRSRATLMLPETLAVDEIRISDVEAADGGVEGRGLITEVTVNGVPNDQAPFGASLGTDCLDLGLTLSTDGAPTTVPVRLTGTFDAALRGAPIEFRSCAPVELEGGWYLLDTVPGLFDELVLTSGRLDPRPTGSLMPLEARQRTATEITADLSADASTGGPSVIVLANSFNAGWQLAVDGGDWQEATAVDGLNGWTVERGSTATFRYAPQRFLKVAIAVSAASLAVCVVLVARRRGQERTAIGPTKLELGLPPIPAPRHPVLAGTLVTALGYLVLGPVALVVGAATVVGLITVPRVTAVVGAAAPLLLGAAAAASTLAEAPSPGVLGIGYALRRPTANELALVAGCYLLMSVLVAIVDARRDAGAGHHHDDRGH